MDQGKTQNEPGQGLQSGRLKRKYYRAMVSGFVGNIADGQKMVNGIVENISAGGFEITNLPQSFTGEGYTYTAVLSGGGKHYKVLTKPCWRRKQGENNINIGFKILDAPWEWLEFTMHGIPQIRGN